jgi:peptide-methionine (S)-S-oxide reductase
MKAAFHIIEIFLVFGLLAGAGSGGSSPADVEKAQHRGEAKMEKATFAAGCFWGVEATFSGVEGVVSTRVGYTGGRTENPGYHDVCSNLTGHAEAVEVTYDPAVVSFDDLLRVFWELHDPTQVNRQGPDVGGQYRSAIFFHSPEQEEKALASKQMLEKSGRYKKPVATEIVSASTFYRAEEYHQQYIEKRGGKSCGSH